MHRFVVLLQSGFAKGGAWGRVFPNGSGTAICPCKCHCHASAISSLPSKPTHPFRKSYHLCIRKKGGSFWSHFQPVLQNVADKVRSV